LKFFTKELESEKSANLALREEVKKLNIDFTEKIALEKGGEDVSRLNQENELLKHKIQDLVLKVEVGERAVRDVEHEREMDLKR
jgi:hypothetical protein